MIWWNLRRLRSTNSFARQKAAEKLGDSKSPAAVEPLMAVWRADRFVDSGRTALGSLVRLGPLSVEALIGAQQDESRVIRKDAARALGGIGDARAASPLGTALSDGDLDVRREAAEALVKIGEPAVQPVVAGLSSSPVLATETLGRLRSSAAVEPLARALKDRDPDVRVAAAKALGAIRDRRAVEPLAAVLRRDKAAVVRQAAVQALHEIPGERALPALVDALADPDAGVREAARNLGAFNADAALAAAFERSDWRQELIRRGLEA